jgi:NAD(P)-dependent dehydrogenase (short-subunit alcohol dehydrogenase family)
MIDPEEVIRRAARVDQIGIGPHDVLLTDQVAIVTGGGGGIGQGTALGLARFGARVAIVDIEPERCGATESAIRRAGGDARGIVADVMDPVQLRDAVSQTYEHFGRLDILVNNAGGVRAGRFVTQPEASVRRHVELNLMSMFFATQEAARIMIDGGRGGAIVNVSSIEGWRAAPMFAVYAACKAAMHSFTKTMAVELAEHGIRVNGIAPDHTITPGNHGNRTGPVDPAKWTPTTPEDQLRWARLIPLGREGLVEECAAAAVWLSSAMSAYVTGTTIAVDGGTWAAAGWTRQDTGWTLTP